MSVLTRDITCPDCGFDPHHQLCKFAWMGPPPTEFIMYRRENEDA